MSFLAEYKHIFVAVSFVCVMILLYYLVYSSSALLSQSVNLVKPGQQIITPLASGYGKPLSSRSLDNTQLGNQLGNQLGSAQSPDVYLDDDYSDYYNELGNQQLSSAQLSTAQLGNEQSPDAYSDYDNE